MNRQLNNQLFIDNQWITPTNSGRIASINPSDESIIGEVVSGGVAEIDQAVDSSRRAFNGVWRNTKPWDRGRIMMRISALVIERLAALTELEMLETGKPANVARSAMLQVARYFEFYAGMADKIQGSTIPIGEGYLDFTLREPIGVTAHITPWNVPLNMLARGVAPALAAGCTAIVKPAELTPMTSLMLAEIMKDANLPAGVVNIINGYGVEAGAALASHAGIDALIFTGSVATGTSIMKACAEHITPVVLELGGKSPLLVFDDCDPRSIAAEAAKGIYSNTGQYCDAGSRLILSKKIHDDVVECLLEKTQSIVTGMPDDNPDMGPVISAAQHKKILDYVNSGLAEGALLACGGKRPQHLDNGYFIEPTVFTNVQTDFKIAQEEIFGPVLSVFDFEDEEEAIAMANGTDYGLSAGIFTKDINRALRLAKQIQSGTVYLNEYFSGEMASPFGGVKKSGIGRERGLETMANYTQIKNVIVKISDA